MEKPRVAVGALIFAGDHVLLVRSRKWHNKYILPGGHVEFGERLTDAVKREVREETGLIVDDVEYVEYCEVIDSNEFWTPHIHFVGHNFTCHVKEGHFKLNEEAQAYVWCSLQKALELDLVPVTRHTIETVLRRKAL
jgi:ADP-ribose pyrophosphatase YjhB (NUDIX family)